MKGLFHANKEGFLQNSIRKHVNILRIPRFLRTISQEHRCFSNLGERHLSFGSQKKTQIAKACALWFFQRQTPPKSESFSIISMVLHKYVRVQERVSGFFCGLTDPEPQKGRKSKNNQKALEKKDKICYNKYKLLRKKR